MIYVTCRPLALRDLSQIVALDERCFGGLWSQSAYQRERESPNSDLLVLEIEDTVDQTDSLIGVGCLWAILEEAHITVLGIDPAYQRRGLGQWLLTRLLLAASDRGLTHATLEVRQSNQKAQALYQKFGFNVAGERKRYYANGENALILWKNGLQTPEFTKQLSVAQAKLREQVATRGWSVREVLLATEDAQLLPD
ncbi:ribosomal protein S18-alanine N-acetyltransferase [Oscillatoria sp. CS-180]|uniref:ribosomal protein S18-alanine N-acetyltransferase n=1 Tax=Oscillatoria sp. CS-180 TaxID=3021720 RepID=UPI00232C0528|nr:ribosomal protein S18-alanine N-acetyltransferase [Oscillatoria sp. CS-180]MDB9525011.1 ribosomal protein S18-alanine N-acetyltransferase [Oscillatoria sp. CS-180]